MMARTARFWAAALAAVLVAFPAPAGTPASGQGIVPKSAPKPTDTSPALASKGTQTIPSIAALMKEVLANQDQVDRLRENYSCIDARTVRTLDKHGSVKKTETYVYQVSFLGPLEVDRLIEKNGQPLKASAQKKEDERNAKEMRKYEKKQGDKAGGNSKEQERAAATIQDFLRADQFINPRHENRAGEDLIVFHFERNSNYKPKNLIEKVVQALTGAIWIDEKAREVAQLDARFKDNVKVGGGLVASLHKGSAVSFVQTVVDHEVWLPTFVSVRLSARGLLFFGLNIDRTDRYSGYQKFHVNVRSTISPSAKPKY